ncbi:Mss4-like protein [Aspergillus novoparasiticus]|uniref:Mss4-like protein n=1 Tax=Aspergillus novoparasiticus TaxID=986946 RepID=A0A5N6EMV6_9EURO|nr:Mss4-like protein [Aspergillus novoparasiticus]
MLVHEASLPLQGGCACGSIRYQVEAPPLFIHCCHCTDCQRETGSAFALNMLIESEHVKILTGAELQVITTASDRDPGQQILRCAKCYVALRSFYPDHGPFISFIRVGTLDQPRVVTPDIHLFVRSKVPWLLLPDGVLKKEELYNIEEVWTEQSILRRKAVLPKVAAYYCEKGNESLKYAPLREGI